MDDTKKMLRAVINGQSTMKTELLTKIEGVDKKVGGLSNKIDSLEKKMDGGFKKVNERIDKLGRSLLPKFRRSYEIHNLRAMD